MTQLQTMTKGEIDFMARRMPRTFRDMCSKDPTWQEKQARKKKRLELLEFDWDRHQAVKKLSRILKPRKLQFSSYTNRDKIMRMIVRHSRYGFHDICSRRRFRPVVKARQAAMWLLRKHTSLSLPQIGKCFGGRDHTTVLHAIKKIEADPDEYAYLIDPIEEVLR